MYCGQQLKTLFRRIRSPMESEFLNGERTFDLGPPRSGVTQTSLPTSLLEIRKTRHKSSSSDIYGTSVTKDVTRRRKSGSDLITSYLIIGLSEKLQTPIPADPCIILFWFLVNLLPSTTRPVQVLNSYLLVSELL